MKFVEYLDVSKNNIRTIEDNRIKVNQHWLTMPCAINQYHTFAHEARDLWTREHLVELIDQLLKLAPSDLILLGINDNPQWDQSWMACQAHANHQGIGIEQMHRDAAIRTYNVLATEERSIWLILLS